MYLNAERLALANQTVKETFEQCSVAWQAIPHWDTGDPSQTTVPNDNVNPPNNFLPLTSLPKPFEVTLAAAIAPTPDELLATVVYYTAKLAADFDAAVIPGLLTATTPSQLVPGISPAQLLTALIEARAKVEKGGYRAPSCLITDTIGVETLAASTIANGYAGTDVLLPRPTSTRCNASTRWPPIHRSGDGCSDGVSASHRGARRRPRRARRRWTLPSASRPVWRSSATRPPTRSSSTSASATPSGSRTKAGSSSSARDDVDPA